MLSIDASGDHRPQGRQSISECFLIHESKYSDIFCTKLINK